MSSNEGSGQRGSGQISPEDREAFRRRASELGKKLDQIRPEAVGEADATARQRGHAMGQAMRISVELVVGLLVGGFIGRLLDGWLGTTPWLFVLFLVMGFAAAMMNIIRLAKRLQAEAEPLQRSAPSVKVEDEET